MCLDSIRFWIVWRDGHVRHSQHFWETKYASKANKAPNNAVSADLAVHWLIVNTLFTKNTLQDAGYSIDQVKDTGFSAAQMKDAGFSVAQMNSVYSINQLKDAGFCVAQMNSVYSIESCKWTQGFGYARTTMVGPLLKY